MLHPEYLLHKCILKSYIHSFRWKIRVNLAFSEEEEAKRTWRRVTGSSFIEGLAVRLRKDLPGRVEEPRIVLVWLFFFFLQRMYPAFP